MCSGGVLECEWVKLQAGTKLSVNSSGRASRIVFLQYPYGSTEVNRASSARLYRLGSLPKKPISCSLVSAIIGALETRHFTCPQTDVFERPATFVSGRNCIEQATLLPSCVLGRERIISFLQMDTVGIKVRCLRRKIDSPVCHCAIKLAKNQQQLWIMWQPIGNMGLTR